ncbi:hypothetical protein MCP1_210002 [Candidatus Terasakiella magnetica]|nr:hypothetical protein MCP1_210002 [Candidatus Terasakiella magnetica]
MVHATADQGGGGDKHGFDILYDGQVLTHVGAGTTTLTGLNIHDGGKLSFAGANGTNITIDQISLNGTAIDAGQGVKSGGVQVDSSNHNFDLHNGSVSFTVNDGNAGAVTSTTSVTTHTQTLHLDVTGNESEMGGVHLSGFHAGDTISDAGHVWTAGSDGSFTISESQLDGMMSGSAIHHDFTVTSTQGAVGTIDVAGVSHDGTAFTGSAGADHVIGTSGADTLYSNSATADHLVADLNIGATEHDASATLTYTIGGVPDGCSLVSDAGTLHPGADGSYALSSDDMHNLQIVMPGDGSVSDFNLSVTATAQDGSSVASASQDLHVGISSVLGTDGGDILDGGAGNDVIHGGTGNDLIIGGAGDDVMTGGGGGDTFLFDFGGGHDTVNGGQGANWTDTVDLTLATEHGATVSVTVGEHTWTNVSEHAATTIDVGHDKSGEVTIHHAGGEDSHIHFDNIEHIKM